MKKFFVTIQEYNERNPWSWGVNYGVDSKTAVLVNVGVAATYKSAAKQAAKTIKNFKKYLTSETPSC